MVLIGAHRRSGEDAGCQARRVACRRAPSGTGRSAGVASDVIADARPGFHVSQRTNDASYNRESAVRRVRSDVELGHNSISARCAYVFWSTSRRMRGDISDLLGSRRCRRMGRSLSYGLAGSFRSMVSRSSHRSRGRSAARLRLAIRGQSLPTPDTRRDRWLLGKLP